ncbi:MAG: hypothetical protein A3K30_04780 [Deltaproteobacteria bacterium RBG_13_51_10]|nr:MAG: hypothetical protein A3K30_04780 [Deltaproteobacteria bacterium RBG_13_51_10]
MATRPSFLLAFKSSSMIARIKSDDGLVSILLIYEVPFFLSLYCFIALLLAFFLKVNRCLSNYSAFIFSHSSIIFR